VASPQVFDNTRLVIWGNNLVALGGGFSIYTARFYNPTGTGSNIWQEVQNGSMIDPNVIYFSTLLVPASMIPNLPAGCTGL
jgi:hypothetical protein